MKLEIYNDVNAGINFNDIDYGEVFSYTVKCGNDSIHYGMKVSDTEDGSRKCFVDFENSDIYDDVNNYIFLEVIDCKVVKNI